LSPPRRIGPSLVKLSIYTSTKTKSSSPRGRRLQVIKDEAARVGGSIQEEMKL
jgi:hypothetical protein